MRNYIETIIKEFVKNYSENRDTQTKGKEPLISYADDEDKLFYDLKDIVSPSHGLPKDFCQKLKLL